MTEDVINLVISHLNSFIKINGDNRNSRMGYNKEKIEGVFKSTRTDKKVSGFCYGNGCEVRRLKLLSTY